VEVRRSAITFANNKESRVPCAFDQFADIVVRLMPSLLDLPVPEVIDWPEDTPSFKSQLLLQLLYEMVSTRCYCEYALDKAYPLPSI
jgi:hypothetical protein